MLIIALHLHASAPPYLVPSLETITSLKEEVEQELTITYFIMVFL
jgi:hypothetical protein